MNSLKENQKFNKAFIATIICVVLLIMASFVGVTISWLTQTNNNTGGTDIGSVSIQLISNGNVLNGSVNDDGEYVLGAPFEITLGTKNEAVSLNFLVKNTGTINGIVRINFSALLKQVPAHPADHVNPMLIKNTEVFMQPVGWVNLYSDITQEDTYFYYSFLNSRLAPNATASIIPSVTALTDEMANKTIQFHVTAEIVAHSGNAYQIDSPATPVPDINKPFGNLTLEFLEIWTAWKL